MALKPKSTTLSKMASSNEEQRDYSRKVLVVVSGLSPAVVTATFYALAVTAKPLWVPSEVYVVTTGAGLKQLETSLLSLLQNPTRKLN